MHNLIKMKNQVWPMEASIVFILFCLSSYVGTFYVFIVQSSRLNMFYAPTESASMPLQLFMGFVNPFGFFFGLVIALTYGIFRLGMGRLLSILCALAFMVSSNHLHNLIPSVLRDYAKAPFILALILIMGLLIKSPLKQDKLFALSAVAGVILGGGLRLRADLLTIIPFFILALFVFIPGQIRANMKIKIKSLIILLSLFLIAVFMLFLISISSVQQQQYSLSQNFFKIQAGLMSPLNARLGVTPSIYDWGHLFLDEFLRANALAQTKALAPGYDFPYYGLDYLFRIAINFPADMLTRAYAAVLKIIDLPFAYLEPPIGIANNIIIAFYSGRAIILNLLAGSGWFLLIITLFIISTHSSRHALFCLCFLLYFAGLPALQFQGRHYFHLEFITWWALGFIIQHTFSFASNFLRDRKQGKDIVWRPPLKPRLAFALGSFMLLFIPLIALRQYQSWQVNNLLQKYIQADKEIVNITRLPIDGNTVLITNSAEFKPTSKNSISVQYLLAEFIAGHFKHSNVWPALYYERSPHNGRPSFSRSLPIDLSSSERKKIRVFFPAIYYNDAFAGSIYFKGIKMAKDQADSLAGLYRIKDPTQFPLLLTAIIPSNFDHISLYQTLSAWETSKLYTVPINMSSAVVKKLQKHPFYSIDNGIVFKAKNVHIERDNKLMVKGYAMPQTDPYNYPLSDRAHSVVASTLFADVSVGRVDTDLLITKEKYLKKGSYFVAQGELHSGGVTFGLIREGQAAGAVSITDRGPFTVIIEVPANGFYSPGMANNLDGYTSLENRFVVNKAGWIQKI